MAKDARAPVAVVGAGTMGRGIAQAFALAGHPCRLHDADATQLDDALVAIAASLDKGVSLGKTTEERRDAAKAAVAPTVTLSEAVAGAALVVEAAPENMELKVRLFGEIAESAPADALLATNTSSLSVSEMAAGLPRPERFVGMHFFNPVPVMRLVEIVRGERTAAATVERAREFARRLGKEPVVVRDSPGFASSRLGIALGLEAIRMVEAGVASPEDIDKAMTLGYRHPMGPLRLTDLVGLDVRLGIARHLHGALGSEAFRPPELLERMVAEGRLGQKSGRGFYDWSEER